MALSIGTVGQNSTASGSSLTLDFGSPSTDAVLVLVAAINQSANEDILSSWSKSSGTATISSVVEVIASQGAEMYLSAAVVRVTAGGTLVMVGTLTGARRWIIGGFAVTGVPSGLAIDNVYNPTVGADASTGTTPYTMPSVSVETIGDLAIGVGAWEGLRTATITTTPANWTEQLDATIGGAGGDTADSSIYIETYISTALSDLSSRPTINSSCIYRAGCFVIRSAVPAAAPRRWLTLLGAG